MRKDFALIVVGLGLLVLPAPVFAGKKAPAVSCGTAYSVDRAGSVLLQSHGKFSLIEFGPDTVIQDGNGRSVTPADIHRGDWIEYRSEAGSNKLFVNASDPATCSKPQVFGKNS
jgi:hypothetical protein